MNKLTVLMVILAMVLTRIMPTLAQGEAHVSITLTEAFINTGIQAAQTSPTETLTVDLQPGQVVLRLDGTGPAGNPYTLTLTLVPSVQNGQAEWTATALTLNEFELDLSQSNQSGGQAAADTFEGFVAGQGAASGAALQSITVTDTAITLTAVLDDPTAPTIDIVDNDLSLTFHEDAVNTWPAIVTPTNPRLSDLSVDFQPGIILLAGTHTNSEGVPQAAQVSLVPLIKNGVATWMVTAMLLDGQPVSSAEIVQMNDSLVASWRAFFTGSHQTGNLADITLSDKTATFTWDGDLATNGVPAGTAQTNVVMTEADINNFFRVADPADYQASDVTVDLQPNRVVITANWNLPNGGVVPESVTMVPTLENGQVTWTVTAATLGGQPFDADALARMNDALASWWGNAYWGQNRRYEITTLQVTDAELRYTAVPR